MDSTNPEAMAGSGEFETIRVNGVGFAPQKTEHLVLPPEVQTEADLEEFLKGETVKKVGEGALRALRKS